MVIRYSVIGLLLIWAGACSSVYIDAIWEAGDTETLLNTGSESDDTPDTDTFAAGPVFGLLGYGAINALGRDGTTGGANADAVLVTTGAQLQEAIDSKSDAPLVIEVEGHLTHTTGRVLLSGVSDITIVGTGPDAELDSFGITLSGASNIIIQNLTIHHVADVDQDAIRITDGSHHVWVDHCRLYNDAAAPLSMTLYDSLLDISRGSDFVTVSWCHFKDHVKAMYIGHSDINGAEDIGRLNTTWHHNLFTNISPMVLSIRFGSAHLFNNQWEQIPYAGDGTGIAVSSRMNACVRLEQNAFLDVYQPIRTDQSGTTADALGAVELVNNYIQNATVMDTSFTCTLEITYPYIYALNNAAALDGILRQNVGPQ